MKIIGRKIIAFCLAMTVLLSTVIAEGWVVNANEEMMIRSFAGESFQEVVVDEKGTLEDVSAMLPESLEAYTEENELIMLPVTWECKGDYENTNYFYYQFTPKWDESQYCISDETEVPYIWVCLSEEQNTARAVTNFSNETLIYEFLVNELGCNMATVVGILANIERESNFNPTASGLDTNGLISYGICQWNGNRYEKLQNYCSENGYSYSTLEGQLNYLKYELSTAEKSAWNKMQGIENTAAGAYVAGYYWAQYFERCAEQYREVSATRAKDVYWPDYSGETGELSSDLTIAGYNTPSVLTVGNAFSIRGVIISKQTITNVTVGCYDADGKMQISVSANPNSTNYGVYKLDNDFEFNKLEPGIYYYRISATVDEETTVLVNSVFTILAKDETIPSGTYVITPRSDDTYAVGTASDSNVSGTNIELKNRKNSEYQTFSITHLGNGDYSIQIVGTGLLLDVKDNGTTTGTNVQQSVDNGAKSQRWQILPAGKSYCLVPTNATNLCLGIQGDTLSEGANVGVFTSELSDMQRFSIEAYDENWKPIENPFTDVTKNAYYYDAVLWAVGKNVTSGTDSTTFSPEEACTRGQIVTFLWNAEGRPAPKSTENPFTDVKKGTYYYNAILWAVGEGITSGTGDTTFSPDDVCTRGQIVTFLWNAAKRPGATITKNPFTDVVKGTYYHDAILWAVENKIAYGIDADTFDPEDTCTRAQIVTFLYRYYK